MWQSRQAAQRGSVRKVVITDDGRAMPDGAADSAGPAASSAPQVIIVDDEVHARAVAV